MKKIMAILVIIMLFSKVAVAENLATPTDLYDHMIFSSDAAVKISATPTNLCDHVWNE